MSSREDNKRNAIVGGATAAGMGAGAGVGYLAGDQYGKRTSTRLYNKTVTSLTGNESKLSPKQVRGQMKTHGLEGKYLKALRHSKGIGMVAGATIGGTAALEGARQLTHKEVKKMSRLSAFGVEHISKSEFREIKRVGSRNDRVEVKVGDRAAAEKYKEKHIQNGKRFLKVAGAGTLAGGALGAGLTAATRKPSTIGSSALIGSVIGGGVSGTGATVRNNKDSMNYALKEGFVRSTHKKTGKQANRYSALSGFKYD